MPRLRNAVVLAAGLALAGCQGADLPANPTALGVRTLPPPPTAALMFTSDAWSTSASGREIYAVDRNGAALTRLTFCNEGAACDYAEVAPAPDRTRVMTRRFRDQDGDSRLTAADGAELAYLDLARGVEATTVPATSFLTGVDWIPFGQVVLYAAQGAGRGLSDLYRQDTNGANNQVLGVTPDVDERRPRLDSSARIAVYERLTAEGRREAVLFFNAQQQFPLTSVPTGPGTVADGSYRVGSDGDPTFSPDGRQVVLRRLKAVGSDGRGEWDIVIVSAVSSATPERVIATGPFVRGAPDWSSSGIAFPESDPGSTLTRLVVVQPDGSGREVPVTVPARITSVRWLQPPP